MWKKNEKKKRFWKVTNTRNTDGKIPALMTNSEETVTQKITQHHQWSGFLWQSSHHIKWYSFVVLLFTSYFVQYLVHCWNPDRQGRLLLIGQQLSKFAPSISAGYQALANFRVFFLNCTIWPTSDPLILLWKKEECLKLPIEGQGVPTDAGVTSTSPQTEENDHIQSV